MRDNLQKIRDEAYITNLDEYESIGTHWIVVYMNGDNVRYFDRFGVKDIQKINQETHRRQKYHNKYL